LNTLMLQLMAGAERPCHFLNGIASLCHIFKLGREMKKVGNHCFSPFSAWNASLVVGLHGCAFLCTL